MQQNLRLSTITFSVIFLMFISSFALGQATVTSDQPDYMPLSTAVFSGSGFTAFETVVLKVKNLSQPCHTVTTDSSYLAWSVTADANGAFATNWTVCNCPGDSLRLKAQGQTSGLVAYAYFTDANLNSVSVGTASQSVNYGTAASVTYTVSVRATGGGAGPTNVTLTATGLPAGVPFSWSSSSPNFAAPNVINFTAAATIDVILTVAVQSNTNVPASPTFTVTATAGATTRSGNGTLTINRQAVTGNITASDKVYDGSTTATISQLTLTGVLFGDDVSLSGGTATFADKNIGTKTVTATGLTLSGSKAGNYILSNTTATTTASITAKPLTAVFTIADKTYDGSTTATITDRQLVGVLSGESNKVELTGGVATFSDKNVGVSKTVTVTNPMSLTGANSGNYIIGTIAPSTASITFKPVTISFTVDGKVYDGNTTATITSAAVVGAFAGDDVSAVFSGATASFNSANAGTQTVTASGFSLTGADGPAPGNGNYQVNPTASFTSTAVIAQKEITVTFTANNKVYDGGTGATIATRLLVGMVGSDNVTASGGTASFDDPGGKNVGDNKPVTATGFSLAGSDKNNYVINPNSSTAFANITPRGLTVTAQTDNRVYNGTTSSNAAPVVDPLQTGDIIGTAPTQSYDNRNVGTGKTLTASGLVINDGNGGNNYTIIYATNTAGVITAKDISVTAQTDNRVYNGTTSSSVAPAVDPLEAGDAIGTVPTQVYDTRNVGTGKTLTASGLVINDGNGGNNYSVHYLTNLTGIITAKDINVTAQSDTRAYNGTTSSAVAPVVDPLETGDAIGTAPAQSYDNRNVGTGKMLTASGLVINDGNSGNNYNIIYVTNTTGVITAKDINVTAQSDTRVYNGTTSSAVAPVVDPLQTGDAIGTAPAQVYDTRNVGTNKTLTASGLVINDGNDGNNYSVHYLTNTTGIITAKDINVTAQPDARTYNGTTSSTVVPVVDPLEAGDAIGSAPAQSYDNRNVGTGKTLTASGLVINDGNSGNNYSIHYLINATGIITAKDINVTAQTDNRVYNGTTNSSVAPVVDPLETGDAIGTAPAQVYDTRNVGTNKTLTASGLVINDGNDGNNYSVHYLTNTTGIITAKDINVTAQPDARTYNGTTSSTVVPVVDPLETGDAIGTAPAQAFNTKHTGTNKTLIANGLVINDGNGGNNYSIHYLTNSTGIIIAKDINVTAQHDERIYNGTTSSAVAPTVEPLQAGDLIGTPAIQKYDTKNVGMNKTLTPCGLIINDGNSGLNYSIHYLTDLTGIISAKGITGNITAADKVYDGTTSATIVTRTLIGVIGTDMVSYTGGTATFDDVPAGTGKNVGNNKPVTATGLYLTGADAGNYTVNSSATTTANITPKGLSITANNLSSQYSDPVVFTVNYAGFAPGEGPGNLGGSLTFATTPAATTGTNPVIATGAPGAYTITPGGLTSSNYAITFKTGVLTITKEDAKITYTGSALVATTGTATTATLTLSATIQDITAVLADPAYDTYPGDIRKATITFNIDGVDKATVPIGLVSNGDTKTGTAVYNFTGASLGDHTIILKLNGYYTGAASGDNQLVVEVYQATGDFITGGGYLKLTNSSGLKAGDAGTKNNFGFNIKYNKSGTNLQGHINTIVRRMEAGILRIYQIKGNSMTSLTVNATANPRTAVFNGKANITDITNPLSPVSVSGNSTLQVSMTDAGEPGTNDKIGIVVYNNTGGVWFSSNWDGTKTVQQTLGGGNLVVHSNNNVGTSTSTSTAVRTATITTDQNPTSSLSDKFSVRVYPTVSETYFTINVQSNTADVVEVKVFDITGRQVEMARGGIGNPIRIGYNLASGTYILSVKQGKNNESIRVSKQ